MKVEIAAELIKRVLPAFEVKELLGRGSFGAVFKIKDSLKERAAKFIMLDASASVEQGAVVDAEDKIDRDFKHIVDNYEKIACDEIVTVYDFYKLFAGADALHGPVYAVIVMEMYPANLLEYLINYFKKHRQPVPPQIAATLIEKVARMLGDLYTKRGFLFEDIKPENILIREQNGDFKLVVGDIGGLKSLGSVTTTNSQVTLAYCAAEVMRKGQKPDIVSVVYSFGLLSYFIFEGCLPYENVHVKDRIDMIREKGVFFHRMDVPDNMKKVIERCLAFEPRDRYQDFNEVLAAIAGREVLQGNSFGQETIVLGGGGGGGRGGDETINLGGLGGPAGGGSTAAPPGGGETFYGSGNMDSILGYSGDSSHTLGKQKRRVETSRIFSEKESIGKVENELRDLHVKEGEVFRLSNDSYKVYGDIVVGKGALLNIDSAKLFFDAQAGILVHGGIRATKSVFSAIDMKKRWLNITLCSDGSRQNYFRNCQFRFPKGRQLKSIRSGTGIRAGSLNENYSYGGGLLLAEEHKAKTTLSDCTFFHCVATSGGGIFLLRSEARVENCRFTNCSATSSGGGIFALESNALVKTSLFSRCTSGKEGGGLYCASSSPMIEDCTFTNCSTKYFYGGGIFAAASSPKIKGCKFTGCSSHRGGGAIYCDKKSKPNLIMPSFTGCKPDNTNCGY